MERGRAVTSKLVKTRTLLLLSVACGLLILLAGGVKLLQVASDDPAVPVLSLGEVATIGDMTVSVSAIDPDGGVVTVLVSMSGVPGESALEGWRLLGDGQVSEPLGGDPSGGSAESSNDSSNEFPNEFPNDTACTRDTVLSDADTLRCSVRFGSVETVQAVAYVRAGEQRQWAP